MTDWNPESARPASDTAREVWTAAYNIVVGHRANWKHGTKTYRQLDIIVDQIYEILTALPTQSPPSRPSVDAGTHVPDGLPQRPPGSAGDKEPGASRVDERSGTETHKLDTDTQVFFYEQDF